VFYTPSAKRTKGLARLLASYSAHLARAHPPIVVLTHRHQGEGVKRSLACQLDCRFARMRSLRRVADRLSDFTRSRCERTGKWMALLPLLILLVFGAGSGLRPAEANSGNVYYVAPYGDDSAPGTQSQPWRTIQKAANTMTAGDSVRVAAGTYPERVTVSTSGTIGAMITFSAIGDASTQGFTVIGDYIKIEGFTVTATACSWNPPGAGIWIEGDYFVVDNNYLYNSPRAGLHTRPSSSGGTITNNRAFRNGQAGFIIEGTNHLVENNEVWGTVAYHTATSCSNDADGFLFFGTGHAFRGNYIHDIDYSGENQGQHPHIDCFQTWSDEYHEAAHDVIFEQNVCINLDAQSQDEVGQGFMVEGGASDLLIRNNIIQAFRIINTVDSSHLAVVNNSFTGRLSAPSEYYPMGISVTNTPYMTIMNNIFYDIRGSAIVIKDSASSQGLDVGYNCVYRSDGIMPGGSPYPNDLWNVNPMFMDASAGDFHLRPDSPLMDAGEYLTSVVNDFDNTPRPQGAGYDIGAFESLTAGPTATPVPSPTPLPPSPTQTPMPTTLPPSPTRTLLPTTAAPSATSVPSPTATPTPTSTSSFTVTPTPTFTPTTMATWTRTPTRTPTAISTAIRADTSTATAAATETPTRALLAEDINLDGHVDVVDVQLCVNVFLGKETDPGIVARANVNADGQVNVLDVQQIVNLFLAG
jgi:parallel beta-helix repeat protein